MGEGDPGVTCRGLPLGISAPHTTSRLGRISPQMRIDYGISGMETLLVLSLISPASKFANDLLVYQLTGVS